MDEEMAADMNGEDFWPTEIDFDYEFDACRFFDFTRPESDAEAHEAELWFDSARSYPPSPFIIKLNFGKDIHVEVEKSSSPKVAGGDNMNSISYTSDVDTDLEVSSTEMDNKGLKHQNRVQGTLKAKTNSTIKSFKPRSSTLLKPTASHLAKQNKARDVYSSQRGRLQKPSSNKIDERILQKSPGHESQATKRQKLECGYLRKAAHLKHQNSLLHKIAKKVGPLEASSAYPRSKVTVPREPDLETAYRAQRRSFRFKSTSDSSEQAKPNVHAFKARPLNRKILQAPSLPLPKKSMPPLPEFQVFHLKTTERALQHQVLNTRNCNYAVQSEDTVCKRSNSQHPLKEKSRTFHKLKARPLNKIFPTEEDEGLLQNRQEDVLPTELFSKLSLNSDALTSAILPSKEQCSIKGSKENAPSSFRPEFWRCAGKMNQCGSERRIPEVGCQPNVIRSLGIR